MEINEAQASADVRAAIAEKRSDRDGTTTETTVSGGDKQSGETKAVLVTQIVARIHDSGVAHVRKPKDIITKISQLEQSFCDAVDFLNNTSAEITNEATLQEAIEKRCPHFSVLKNVFGDRPSTWPLVTNEDASFLSDDNFEMGLGGESAGAQEDTSPTPDEPPKRAKQNNRTAKRWAPSDLAAPAYPARCLSGAT